MTISPELQRTRADRLSSFRSDFTAAIEKRWGVKLAARVEEIDDEQLLALFQRAQWRLKRAVNYLPVYGMEHLIRCRP